MRTTIASAAAVGLVSLVGMTAFISASAQQARPSAFSATTIDEVLTAVRADLQGERADIIAKNVTLTGDQAAAFWPIFNAYQKEQNAIMDEQLKAIQKFIESFDTMDDAGALGLINGHLDRDAKMAALRHKWLGEFQKALPTKLAVRVMQIDRRLSLMHQLLFTSKIPLAH